MKEVIKKLSQLSALALLVSACGDLQKRGVDAQDNPAYSQIDSKLVVSDFGTVHFNDFESDHYVIHSDNGETYLPTQLAAEFQVDGLRIKFEGRLAKDAFMTHMSGQIINLDSIRAE